MVANRSDGMEKTYKDKITEVATTIYPQCIETVIKLFEQGHYNDEDDLKTEAAKMTVRYAVKLLKEINHYCSLSLDEQKEY